MVLRKQSLIFDVGKLKTAIKNLPDDTKVFVRAPEAEHTTELTGILSVNLTEMVDTGATFLGIPVVGGKPEPAIILLGQGSE